MIRKFKCIACGKKFDADDKDTIVCPKCHSDNVKPVKPDYLRPIGLALVLLVSVGAGMFVTKQCKSIELESGVVTPEIEIDTIGDTTKIKHDIDPELLKTIEIQNTLPVYDKKTKAYSLNVTAKNIPAGAKVIYELCQEYDPMNHIKKVLMTSDDGNFENVPASKNECSTYYVVVCATEEGSAIPSQTRSPRSLKSPTRRRSQRLTTCSSSLVEQCLASAVVIRV